MVQLSFFYFAVKIESQLLCGQNRKPGVFRGLKPLLISSFQERNIVSNNFAEFFFDSSSNSAFLLELALTFTMMGFRNPLL